MSKSIKFRNNVFLDSEGVSHYQETLKSYLNNYSSKLHNSYWHGDGTYNILVAEWQPHYAYHRSYIAVMGVTTGYTDSTDTGICIFAPSCGQTVNDQVVCAVTNIGNIQGYYELSGNVIKMYLRKTVHYRHYLVIPLSMGSGMTLKL